MDGWSWSISRRYSATLEVAGTTSDGVERNLARSLAPWGGCVIVLGQSCEKKRKSGFGHPEHNSDDLEKDVHSRCRPEAGALQTRTTQADHKTVAVSTC